MNIRQLVVLALAAIAALFVAMYVRGQSTASATVEPATTEITEIVEMPSQSVLVARADLRPGQRVTPEDIGWQPWPDQAISDAFMTQDNFPDALETYVGAVSRDAILRGEPITGRKLVNPGEAGFMAAVLTPGMRAVSVAITAESGAGGFILPGDKVDVILTQEIEVLDGRTTRDEFVARTVLENVRVLAIDQTPSSDDEDQAVVGSTATLELTSDNAEMLALAEALGEITLALRSVVESLDSELAGGSLRADAFGDQTSSRRIIRYGATTTVNLGGSR